MSALRANTSTQTVSPSIDSSVNNVLLQTNPEFNRLLLEFIHILERHLIDLLLHDPQSLQLTRLRSELLGGHRSGEMKSEVSHSNSSTASRADALVRCTADTRTCHQRRV